MAPLFHTLTSSNYDHELRNCIAHSLYYFGDRSIELINDQDEHIRHIPFEEWRDRFNTMLHIQNGISQLLEEANKLYIITAISSGNRIPVRRIDQNGEAMLMDLSRYFGRWVPTFSLEQMGLHVKDVDTESRSHIA